MIQDFNQAKLNKALFDAASVGQVAWAFRVLDKGADPHARNADGWTPLHMAAWIGSEPLCKGLVARGADMHDTCAKGWTPLLVASGSKSPTLVAWLIESGAQVHARGPEGRMPIHCAADRGRVENIDVLMHHGADVNAQDVYGSTPLHLLARKSIEEQLHFRSTDTAIRLLEHGADLKARDTQWRTPWELALKGEFHDVAAVLWINNPKVATNTSFRAAGMDARQQTEFLYGQKMAYSAHWMKAKVTNRIRKMLKASKNQLSGKDYSAAELLAMLRSMRAKIAIEDAAKESENVQRLCKQAP